MRTLQTNANMGKEPILYKELSYKIVGLLYKTHDELGRYALEKQYADFLESLLKEEGLFYERERVALAAEKYRNRAGFVVEDSILLKLKVKPGVGKNDYYQVQRYLNALNLKLGLLVNFRHEYLYPKRVINFKRNNS